YRRAVTIVDAEQLGGAMTEKLAELFEDPTTLRRSQKKARGQEEPRRQPLSTRGAAKAVR
ncbi:cobaltochelatase CobT-related protein, partial [Parvibaculum sp.]|uniref:cobaltochelatase CobT-related protein n=1 Tax=Parvibaculum sp. TaxID=2024848 RepID=UPI003C7373DB